MRISLPRTNSVFFLAPLGSSSVSLSGDNVSPTDRLRVPFINSSALSFSGASVWGDLIVPYLLLISSIAFFLWQTKPEKQWNFAFLFHQLRVRPTHSFWKLSSSYLFTRGLAISNRKNNIHFWSYEWVISYLWIVLEQYREFYSKQRGIGFFRALTVGLHRNVLQWIENPGSTKIWDHYRVDLPYFVDLVWINCEIVMLGRP